jgi:hypothetical protein
MPSRVITPLKPQSRASASRMEPKRGSSSTIRMTGSPGETVSRSSLTISIVSAASSSGVERTVMARAASRPDCAPFAAVGLKFSGRNRVKTLPFSGSLSTFSSPPSVRVISRLIDRPSPVPPYLRLVVPSACWKASKMIRCLSSGMPMPLSWTEKAST